MKKNTFSLLVSVFFLLIVSTSISRAQDTLGESGLPASADQQQDADEIPVDADDILINSLIIESFHGLSSLVPNSKVKILMLGDTLVMQVKGLDELIKRRTLENPIILFINRLPFESIIGHRNIHKHNEFVFILNRFAEDNEDWNVVLRSGLIDKNFDLQIGLKDKSLVSSNAVDCDFKLRTKAEFIPFSILVLLLISLTGYLVFKKGLLRVNTPTDNTYSLSSIHLFFWTSVILISYMIIWWSCDDVNSIEPSNLILMGISAATASVGVIINRVNGKPGEQQEVNQTKGFITDLFSENNSISVNRYQIVVFNLVIGVFFIYRVISELTMPVLNESILALLGISSATYASVKAIQSRGGNGGNLPQTQAAPAPAPVTPAPPVQPQPAPPAPAPVTPPPPPAQAPDPNLGSSTDPDPVIDPEPTEDPMPTEDPDPPTQ